MIIKIKTFLVKFIVKILEWWYYKVRKYPRIIIDEKPVEPEGKYRI